MFGWFFEFVSDREDQKKVCLLSEAEDVLELIRSQLNLQCPVQLSAAWCLERSDYFQITPQDQDWIVHAIPEDQHQRTVAAATTHAPMRVDKSHPDRQQPRPRNMYGGGILSPFADRTPLEIIGVHLVYLAYVFFVYVLRFGIQGGAAPAKSDL